MCEVCTVQEPIESEDTQLYNGHINYQKVLYLVEVKYWLYRVLHHRLIESTNIELESTTSYNML